MTLGRESAATCTWSCRTCSRREGHARGTQEVAHLCSAVFPYRTSPEIDEGLYLRRGTSYGLTSCVFRVMPRDLIVLLIINRERRYTSRSREATERMPVAAVAYGGRCVTVFVGRSRFRSPWVQPIRCSLQVRYFARRLGKFGSCKTSSGNTHHLSSSPAQKRIWSIGTSYSSLLFPASSSLVIFLDGLVPQRSFLSVL